MQDQFLFQRRQVGIALHKMRLRVDDLFHSSALIARRWGTHWRILQATDVHQKGQRQFEPQGLPHCLLIVATLAALVPGTREGFPHTCPHQVWQCTVRSR